MSITKHCTIEGYTECHITVTDQWTRGELRTYFKLTGEAFVDFHRTKIEACYLATADGSALEDPKDLTNENLDRLDWLLFRWFSMAFQTAIFDVQRLGEAKVQQSLRSTEEKPNSETP